MIAELVAFACVALFTGAAVYISLVQHPAAARLGTSKAVAFFGPMYSRAAPLQASLALLGALAAIWAWWSGGGRLWLIGAVLIAFVIPFTLVIIEPTNDRLMDPSLDSTSDEATALLVRWARLHAVRGVAGFAALLVLAVALAKS